MEKTNLLATTVFAFGIWNTTQAAESLQLIAGLGLKSETSIYRTMSDEIGAVPLIDFEYGPVYWKGTDIGLLLFENKNVEFGPSISLFEGYGFSKGDLSTGLSGLKSRDSGYSYGVTAAFEWEPFTLEIKPMLHSQEGSSIGLSLEHEYEKGSFSLMSSVFLNNQDTDYNNYYFGVASSEVSDPKNSAITEGYTAKSASNIGVEMRAIYKLTPRWLLTAALEQQWLDSSITDSPLVDSKTTSSGLMGVAYRFR